jgi:subtilisin-like proprotein convertase family protein
MKGLDTACFSIVLTPAIAAMGGGLSELKPGPAFSPRVYGPQDPVMATARTILRGTVNNPAADTTAHDTQSAVALASPGGGKLVAAFNDTGSTDPTHKRNTGYAYSVDGGASWVDGGTVPAYNPVKLAAVPALAADPALGRVYLAAGSNTANTGLPVWRSSNGGQSWVAKPADGTGGTFLAGNTLLPSLAVDTATGTGKSNVYLCYYNDDTDQVLFARSTDKGVSFPLADREVMEVASGMGCAVAVGPQHDVYVFYLRKPGASNQLMMRRSTNRGASFGAPVVVRNLQVPDLHASLKLAGNIVSQVVPSVAVNPDPARPWIYVTYADSPNAATGADNGNIFLTYSKDRGATWSAAVAVDAGARDQFMPAIGFASKGNVMVTYNSRSQDPANGYYHRRARIGRLTATGAVSFNASFQLGPNTPNVAGQDSTDSVGNIENGWRDAVIGVGGKFLTAWSDSRSGNVFHARQPEVRFAAIAAPVPSADLRLALTASSTAMTPLQQRLVKARLTSVGGVSNDAFLSVAVPAGMIVEPPGGADCTVTGQFLGCSLGTIAAGKFKDVYFQIRADATTGTRTLRAYASSSSRDTAQSNNRASKALSVLTSAGVTASFTTGNLATPIPDFNTVDIPITVGVAGTVLNVKAEVRLDHEFDYDLDLYLIEPNGQIVELSTDNGLAGDNYGSGANDCSGTPTVFDDAAATGIAAGAPPFAGSFKPEGALSGFLGKAANGTWKLRVTDDALIGSGTVGCVTLIITRKP